MGTARQAVEEQPEQLTAMQAVVPAPQLAGTCCQWHAASHVANVCTAGLGTKQMHGAEGTPPAQVLTSATLAAGSGAGAGEHAQSGGAANGARAEQSAPRCFLTPLACASAAEAMAGAAS